MVQILIVFLPTRLRPQSLFKLQAHAIDIFMLQPCQTHLERIVDNSHRRLLHAVEDG
ncbi:hypothetical protein D3C72_2517050 [compost metagenome]